MKTKKLNKNFLSLLQKYEKLLQKFRVFKKTSFEFPNPYGYKIMKKNLSGMKKELECCNPISNLETKIKNQIKYAVNCFEAYIEFKFNYYEFDIDQFIDVVFGKNALKALFEAVKTINYKNLWQFYMYEEQFSHNRVSHFNEHDLLVIREGFLNLKKLVLDWGFRKALIPKGFSVDLQVDPYGQGSDYDPETKTINIDINYILGFKESKKMRYNFILVIPIIFHEYFGHALNGFYSQNNPTCFQADYYAGTQFFNIASSEGIALEMARLSEEFASENKDILKLKKNDFLYLDCLLEVKPDFFKVKALIEYIKLKKTSHPNLNMPEMIYEISNNPGFAQAIGTHETYDFEDFIYNFSVFLGNEKIQKIKKKYKTNIEFIKKLLMYNSGLDIFESILK